MTPDQFHELRVHIEEVIQSKVNGKIDRISDRQISMEQKFDAFVARAEPAVMLFENLTWARKAAVGAIIFISAVASVIGVFPLLAQWLRR